MHRPRFKPALLGKARAEKYYKIIKICIGRDSNSGPSAKLSFLKESLNKEKYALIDSCIGRDSNSGPQLGRLRYYHYTTDAR